MVQRHIAAVAHRQHSDQRVVLCHLPCGQIGRQTDAWDVELGHRPAAGAAVEAGSHFVVSALGGYGVVGGPEVARGIGGVGVEIGLTHNLHVHVHRHIGLCLLGGVFQRAADDHGGVGGQDAVGYAHRKLVVVGHQAAECNRVARCAAGHRQVGIETTLHHGGREGDGHRAAEAVKGGG